MEEKKPTKKLIKLVDPDPKLKSIHLLSEENQNPKQVIHRKPDPILASSEIKGKEVVQRKPDPKLVSNIMKGEVILESGKKAEKKSNESD